MSIIIDRTPPITRITLNRPDTHNAFDETLIAQLTEAFESLREDAASRVVVLQGAGKSFCAGAVLHWMGKMVNYSFAENLEDARRLARMFEAIDPARSLWWGGCMARRWAGARGWSPCAMWRWRRPTRGSPSAR